MSEPRPTPRPPPPPRPPASLDENQCISLRDILESFNAPISEEQAWALCYQCAKAAKNCLRTDPLTCHPVSRLEDVLIHRDGIVHPDTFLKAPVSSPHQGSSKELIPTEQNIANRLGLVVFRALDFGFDKDEERPLSPELTQLILRITTKGEEEGSSGSCTGETDDEGIERDSAEEEETTSPGSSLSLILQECLVQVGGSQEADSHYRAVCRALVAEALELASFLQRVSEGDIPTQPTTANELEQLNFSDWARLWVQVIRELRLGVKLKKVSYSRKPLEYELTPYEILMEDIRSRRYKLNKVPEKLSGTLKKDAHAAILDYIRSRPPLKKASERKLPPARSASLTPREALLESIKTGQVKLKSSPRDTGCMLERGASRASTRRLIKIDYSFIPDDQEEEEECPGEEKTGPRWQRTGSVAGCALQATAPSVLQSYDLAWSGTANKGRRHTVVVCPSDRGSLSVPPSRVPSRPQSRQDDSTHEESDPEPSPHHQPTSLQQDLLSSKTWEEECLSLTLEEIVHIRSVLTKAELESLPVEANVKEDADKRRVCFLCMKTRFGIFGPWGQICKLCKRTVCTKCYSKMRVPTEQFSRVPVVALSPSMLSPVEGAPTLRGSLAARLGSAPASPRDSTASVLSDDGSYHSLPSPHYSTDKWRLAADKALGRTRGRDKLRGLQMVVCLDCKTMVMQIIKSSRETRNNAIRNLTLDLSPVY